MKTKNPVGKKPASNGGSLNRVVRLSYGDQCRIAEAIGMSLGEYELPPADDTRGLAFTVCGGKLRNGRKAEDWIANLNGCGVDDIATEALERGAVVKVGRWNWKWVEPNEKDERQ